MKVAPTNSTASQKRNEILLSLTEDPEMYTLESTNSVSWELCTQPADTDSTKYKFQVVSSKKETKTQLSLLVHWRLDVLMVCVGLAAGDLASHCPIIEACMRTEPLSLFSSCLIKLAQRAYETALGEAREHNVAATQQHQ